MKNFIKSHRFLSGLLSVFISVFLVSVVAYAATTIGTNIETAGTGTFESASTSNDFWLGNLIADDDDSLYFDASGTEYLMWDNDPGQFVFSNDLKITGVTTSSLAFWAGDGGTVDNINMTGGDLYVQNDAEIDGTLYITTDLEVTNKATSTVAFAVGSGTIDNLSMTGGDLYVLDDVEIDGSLWFDSATTTDSLFIGSYASSTSALNTQGTLHVGGNATIDGFITLGDYASSTSELNTQGTLHVGGNATIDGTITANATVSIAGAATTTGSHYIGGTASTTELYVQGDTHIGGNADVDGTLNIGEGDTITKFMFGTCNIGATTVNATSTAYTECLSATGVISDDNIFITATSSLPENFIIQAASSTISNEISLRIYNTGSIEGTATGARTFFWQAIR